MPEYRNHGDALRGDRIAVSARSISRITVINRTSSHKGQSATLRNNAFCVIEMPLKVVTNKKQ